MSSEEIHGPSLISQCFRWISEHSLQSVVLLFLATRLLALSLPEIGSDIDKTAGYALEYELAQQRAMSVYEFRALPLKEKESDVRIPHNAIRRQYGEIYEYPPLALIPTVLPYEILKALYGPQHVLEITVRHYQLVFRLQMFLVDMALFSLVAVLLRKLYPSESWQETSVRLLVYVGGGFLLIHLLYDRLDLAMAALVTLSLGLLTVWSRKYLSYVVIAISIGFKLVPLFFLPVWCLGGLRHRCLGESPSPRSLGIIMLGVVMNSMVVITMIVACFVPALLTGGTNSVSFLEYHKTRQFDLVSTYGSFFLAASKFGMPIKIYFSHGSFNIDAASSPMLVRGSQYLMVGSLLALAALYLYLCIRASRNSHHSSTGLIASLNPTLTISMVTCSALVIMLTSKVLSPQYMIWLIPLVSLMPGTNRQRIILGLSFWVTCGLTTLVFPVLTYKHLLGLTPSGDLLGPTWLGISTLVVRNLGLLGLLAFVLRISVQESSRCHDALHGASESTEPCSSG